MSTDSSTGPSPASGPRIVEAEWKLKDFPGLHRIHDFCFVEDAIAFLRADGFTPDEATASISWHVERGHFQISQMPDGTYQDVTNPNNGAISKQPVYRSALTATAGWLGFRAKDGPWSRPASPQEWARVFNVSRDTIVGYFTDGKIQAKKLSDRVYQVYVDHLPQQPKSE